MKTRLFISILCALTILIGTTLVSCENAQDEELSTEPLLTSEYPVWLERIEDDVIDARDIDVPKGTVMVSESLKKEIAKYTDDTEFAVGVSFASMVPDDYLDSIYEDGMSAQEYFDLGMSLQETDPEASDKAFQTYNGLKHEYFNDLLNSLNYCGEIKLYGLMSDDSFFFYTYMTKEEILNLTCDEDESYYIAAMGRYK